MQMKEMKGMPGMEMRIRQANTDDSAEVSRLFNEYRMFYGQNSDLEAASSL